MFNQLEQRFKRFRNKVSPNRHALSPKLIWAQLSKSRCKAVLLDTPHGFFWTKPGDSAIGFSLFANGEFDFADFSRLRTAIEAGVVKLPPDPVFLDVGANIGTHTIYALNSGLFSRAVCFEPDPENFRFLTMNIAENGYADRCDLRNVALGSGAGVAELELAADNFGDHRIRHEAHKGSIDNRYDEQNRKTVSVPMETLDEALEKLGIAADACFLHMDVQGFEPYVLEGAKKFLDSCQTIFTEFWPYGMARTGGTESFRVQAENTFSYFIDFGAGKTNTQPISQLKNAFEHYEDGIGTTLLMTKSPT